MWDVICAGYVTVRRPYVPLGKMRSDHDTLGCECKVSKVRRDLCWLCYSTEALCATGQDKE